MNDRVNNWIFEWMNEQMNDLSKEIRKDNEVSTFCLKVVSINISLCKRYLFNI